MIKKTTLFVLLTCGILNAGELSVERQCFGISYGVLGGAGVSYFDKSQKSEISAFVMSYSDDIYEESYEKNKEQSELHLSLHYRKFFKDRVGGYYYGGFARYSKLEGKLKNEHNRATQSKFGIGGEIGYTSFNLLDYPGLYWGSGLGLGMYVSGEHEIFEKDDMLGDVRGVFHLDIIRLGYVF